MSDGSEEIALIMAVTCVRNTIIEDYHAAGKISDPEMAAFNREVANKLFPFLTFMHGSQEDWNDFMGLVGRNYPVDWDRPRLDDGLMRALALFRKRTRPPNHP